MVRKREKLKAAHIRTTEQCVMMKLNPLEAAMHRLLDTLSAKDNQEIFSEPVDVDEVPDYMDVVKEPMDLSTMRRKLNTGEYCTLDGMETDFNLMIQNCLAYNNKDTIFYRAGIRMRDQCTSIFKSVRRELIRDGIIEEPQTDESIAHEIDNELADLLKNDTSSENMLDKLKQLTEKAGRIKHKTIRSKRMKQLRAEIAKAKKCLSMNSSLEESAIKNLTADTKIEGNAAPETNTDSSHSDDEEEEVVCKNERVQIQQQSTPPCSPIKTVGNSSSPSGVNRRTAVLFTRKAQAAASLKRTEPLLHPDESNSCDVASGVPPLASSSRISPNANEPKVKSPKKLGKNRRNNSQSSSGHLDDSTIKPLPSTSTMGQSSGLNASTSSSLHSSKKVSPSMRDRYRSATDASAPVSESFRRYRDHDSDHSTESDESQFSGSDTCSSCSQHNSTDC